MFPRVGTNLKMMFQFFRRTIEDKNLFASHALKKKGKVDNIDDSYL